MSTTLTLGAYVWSLLAVGLFAGLIIALVKYEWGCPTIVAGLVAGPAVSVGYLVAHGISVTFDVALWTALGGLGAFFVFIVVVLELGQQNSGAGF